MEVKIVSRHYITLDEFNKLEVDDINHQKKIFVLGVPYGNRCQYLGMMKEIRDVIENKWKLNHIDRLAVVEEEGVFYVDNMDVKCIFAQTDLLSLIMDDDYDLYYITRGDEE